MKGRRILKIALGCIVCLFIIGYAVFQARKIIEGPKLTIVAPTDGETVSSAMVDISGSARNVAFLYLNNKKIFTDDDGVFKEKAIVEAGVNVIELRADDKFGNEITRRITIFRKN